MYLTRVWLWEIPIRLLVTYDNGQRSRPILCGFNTKKTAVLKFTVTSTVCLEIRGSPAKRSSRSYDAGDEKYLSRCAAYAVETGSSLEKIEEDLKESVRLRVSTAENIREYSRKP